MTDHEHPGHVLIAVVVSMAISLAVMLFVSDCKSHEEYVRDVACAAAACPSPTNESDEIDALKTEVSSLRTPEPTP